MKRNKKLIIVGLSILVGFLIILFTTLLILKFKPKNYQEIELSELVNLNNGTEPDIIIDSHDNFPIAIMGRYTTEKVENSQEAIKSLICLKNIYGIQNPQEEFNLYNEFEFGKEKIYRLNQKYNGYEVYRKQLIVTTDLKGNVKSLSGDYDKIENVGTEAKLSKEDAKQNVKNRYENVVEVYEQGLCIYNLDIEAARLAYKMYCIQEDKNILVFVDAISGEILGEEDATFNITGTGQTISGENVTFNIKEKNKKYQLIDETRNIKIINTISPHLITDTYTVVSSDTTHFEDKEATTLIANMSKVYDFYNQKLGLKSFDGRGTMIIAEIHDKTKNNASFCITTELAFAESNYIYFRFGEGDQQNYNSFTNGVDAIAHEYTHAYVYNMNGGFKNGEINEAFADVVGNIVENYCRERNTIRGLSFDESENLTFSQDENWNIGEDVALGSFALRSMANPEDYYKPSKYMGQYYETNINSFNKNDVIHSNCCVLDNIAYNMWKNGLTTDEILYLFMVTPQKTASTAGYPEIAHMMLSLSKQNFPQKIDSVRAAFELANIAIIDNTTSIKDVTQEVIENSQGNNDEWKELYRKFVLTNNFIDDNVVSEPELLIIDLDFNYVPDLIYNTGTKNEIGETIFQIYGIENGTVKLKDASLAVQDLDLVYDKIDKTYFWGYHGVNNNGSYKKGVMRGLGKNTEFQFINNQSGEFSARYVHMANWKEISQEVVNFRNSYTREQRKESINKAIENYIRNSQITKNYPYTDTNKNTTTPNQTNTTQTQNNNNNTEEKTTNSSTVDPKKHIKKVWESLYKKNYEIKQAQITYPGDEPLRFLVLDLDIDGVPEVITISSTGANVYYIETNEQVRCKSGPVALFVYTPEIKLNILQDTKEYFYSYEITELENHSGVAFCDPFGNKYIDFVKKNSGSYYKIWQGNLSQLVLTSNRTSFEYTQEECDTIKNENSKYQSTNIKTMTIPLSYNLDDAIAQYKRVQDFINQNK